MLEGLFKLARSTVRRMEGMGFFFGVLGFGFWVLGFGFWVLSFGCWVFRVLGLGFSGFVFWVLGLRLRGLKTYNGGFSRF